MIRVAGYCRVSTDKEDQANSFASQQRYFRDYISQREDWELYEIYADEGITGTSTKKRTQFNRMISDAFEGKFQWILTKEVSRFSRNIVDTITYSRELKAIGVGIRFVMDGINTMNPDAELYLSIMASLAQEESRKTSSRVVWGQTRQMEKGVVFGRSLLGYDVINGMLSVNPQGADTVRIIFQKYAQEQVSTSEIARFLTKGGYHTYCGSGKWSANSVIKILKNEKYVGDLLQRKTYTPDYLTHEKRANKGEVPFIYIREHHEPIVSREVWELAQHRLRKNDKHRGKDSGHSNRYVFSGKIKCGYCGAGFVGRLRKRKDGTNLRRWSCGTAVREGASACDVGRTLGDEEAMEMLKEAIRSLPIDSDTISRHVTVLALSGIQAGKQGGMEASEPLRLAIQKVRLKIESVMDSYFSGEISLEDMQSMKQRYEQQEKTLRIRYEKAEAEETGREDEAYLRECIREEILAILSCKKVSEVFCKTMLESLTVYRDRYAVLKLNHLPQTYWFSECAYSQGEHFDPSVPISVNSPFSSSKGME